MLNAVVIILREVLEGSFIASILLASSQALVMGRGWIFIAFILGGLGAWGHVYYVVPISEWLDGVGQDVVNAVTLLFVCGLLLVRNMLTVSHYEKIGTDKWPLLPRLLCIIIVSLVLVRELTEIFIYANSFAGSFDSFLPILAGGSIGGGIGLSIGALFYYGLTYLPDRDNLRVSCILLTLVAAGMASQSMQYFIQADLLPSQQPLWDSSGLVSEASITGHVLYILFGYEATPTAIQVVFYLGVLVLMGAVMAVARYYSYKVHDGSKSEMSVAVHPEV
jgi:high-affinity iron transporter